MTALFSPPRPQISTSPATAALTQSPPETQEAKVVDEATVRARRLASQRRRASLTVLSGDEGASTPNTTRTTLGGGLTY